MCSDRESVIVFCYRLFSGGYIVSYSTLASLFVFGARGRLYLVDIALERFSRRRFLTPRCPLSIRCVSIPFASASFASALLISLLQIHFEFPSILSIIDLSQYQFYSVPLRSYTFPQLYHINDKVKWKFYY